MVNVYHPRSATLIITLTLTLISITLTLIGKKFAVIFVIFVPKAAVIFVPKAAAGEKITATPIRVRVIHLLGLGLGLGLGLLAGICIG